MVSTFGKFLRMNGWNEFDGMDFVTHEADTHITFKCAIFSGFSQYICLCLLPFAVLVTVLRPQDGVMSHFSGCWACCIEVQNMLSNSHIRE